MAAIVDHVCYNNLPSLGEADMSRQALSVDDVINGPIRDVFLKHATHHAFCLYLQHRHHTVAANEAVVKVEGTAHLMDDQAMKDIASFGNKVVPTTWMTSGGKVLPMEFTAIPAMADHPTLSAAFVQEFLSILATNGCEGLFGVDTLAGNNWSEMKIGDASVVVPSNDIETHDQDRVVFHTWKGLQSIIGIGPTFIASIAIHLSILGPCTTTKCH
ncbi:3-hydroxybutyryl-CoA dehydratase [Hirsutella rhossiliensis]|uniref:3-hydroxybutyryl-CoA dehydratase n=1 Tax=Hirsutella rhossiliensis TaxID=111463 RepID=A0A9P8SN74_9HYPO|nr:3-hydroxybutyryl-CoA dehydratase [Hirsutella rhossiliensis]KAH0967580.1 3-hydroxybutyryl-CoA dehydratase [Hirsutella rhossiliensis]